MDPQLLFINQTQNDRNPNEVYEMQKAIHQGGSTGQIQKSQNKVMLLKFDKDLI